MTTRIKQTVYTNASYIGINDASEARRAQIEQHIAETAGIVDCKAYKWAEKMAGRVTVHDNMITPSDYLSDSEYADYCKIVLGE